MPQQVAQTYNIAIGLTKSDTVNFPQYQGRYPDAIWFGGAGIAICFFGDGHSEAFTVPIGLLPVAGIVRINSATTTATLMIGLWQG